MDWHSKLPQYHPYSNPNIGPEPLRCVRRPDPGGQGEAAPPGDYLLSDGRAVVCFYPVERRPQVADPGPADLCPVGAVRVGARFHRHLHLHAVCPDFHNDGLRHRVGRREEQHRHSDVGEAVRAGQRFRPRIEHRVDARRFFDNHRRGAPAVSPAEEQRPGRKGGEQVEEQSFHGSKKNKRQLRNIGIAASFIR